MSSKLLAVNKKFLSCLFQDFAVELHRDMMNLNLTDVADVHSSQRFCNLSINVSLLILDARSKFIKFERSSSDVCRVIGMNGK